MTTPLFQKCLHFVLNAEGGYVNNPSDNGGATNKGITQAVYDNYRKGLKKPAHDVRNISDAEVLDIYYDRYWKPFLCDNHLPALAAVVFDTAVNMGVGEANTKAKETLTTIEAKANPSSHPFAIAGINAAEARAPLLAASIAAWLLFGAAVGCEFVPYPIVALIGKIAAPILLGTAVSATLILNGMPFYPYIEIVIGAALLALVVYYLIRAKGNPGVALKDFEADSGIVITPTTTTTTTTSAPSLTVPQAQAVGAMVDKINEVVSKL